MLTVHIVPNDKGNPPGKLADAELHFVPDLPTGAKLRSIATTLRNIPRYPNTWDDKHNAKGDIPSAEACERVAEMLDNNDPLFGLKLIGFAVWERRSGGGRNVTFPARQYSINGERRSFALLRPIADASAQERIRDLILEAYAEWEKQDEREAKGAKV